MEEISAAAPGACDRQIIEDHEESSAQQKKSDEEFQQIPAFAAVAVIAAVTAVAASLGRIFELLIDLLKLLITC